MKKRRCNKYYLMLLLFLYAGCSLFAKEKAPYIISGQFVMEQDSVDYSICGLDLYVFNKSAQEIKSLTVVFFLFDSDGEPIDTGKNNIVLTVNKSILPKEGKNICLSLDDYMNNLPEENYMVDYLYISRIVYSDNSEWTDPFGMMMF